MNYPFFNQENCDRCKTKLTGRTMSWFTDETICMDCSIEEYKIKKALPEGGKNYEGCGFIPTLQFPIK